MRVPETRTTAAKTILLLRSASASLVANIARLLTGSPRPSRINVLTLTSLITTRIAPDLVVRAMLLLAGHGLLMVVHRARLVFLWFGFFSSLSLARVDGVTTFLMSLRLLLCLPAASQDGFRSDWCSLCSAPFCLDAPRFPPTCFESVSTLSGAVDSGSATSDSEKACSSLAGRLLMPWRALSPSAGPGSYSSEPTASFPSSSCLGALLGWLTSINDELPLYFLFVLIRFFSAPCWLG
jgi:hypothetical protein